MSGNYEGTDDESVGNEGEETLHDLQHVVECIADETLKDILKFALENNDDFVLAAYDVYLSSNDMNDLVDSLLRYAFHQHKRSTNDYSIPSEDANEVAQLIGFVQVLLQFIICMMCHHGNLLILLASIIYIYIFVSYSTQNHPDFSREEVQSLVQQLKSSECNGDVLLGAYQSYKLTQDEDDLVETIKGWRRCVHLCLF